ncbi:hypothetical protein [Fibrobacter sp. UWP2]|uniref:hypothetical protein n=1 Tax=Fibrobacter sp. UWP2 TaxID=1896216 RepID=UPI00091DE6B7|nr:hypothetical protein [Fibrobacter sp. UWP2]SHJ26943.1 hypothetical protein SAMN05720471_12430 [Fibrobacter sp. UWP2]
MNFVKIGENYINIDNVTTIEKTENGYVLHFAGQTHSRKCSNADMIKIKLALDTEKIVLNNPLVEP